MKKNERLSHWLESWRPCPENGLPPEYVAFVGLFNIGAYYEAHDILEHLWLRCADSNRSFFQGLIQLAGAFVHFQKHLRHPLHPTHSRRLAPGARLLALAANRLRPYGGSYWNLNLESLLRVCLLWEQQAREGGNPLQTLESPRLEGDRFRFTEIAPDAIERLVQGDTPGDAAQERKR
jgi:predicted metal-dependent hydrolase